ncbi:hypothetical protein M758_UG257100, partial [Ceratodon purpureus]
LEHYLVMRVGLKTITQRSAQTQDWLLTQFQTTRTQFEGNRPNQRPTPLYFSAPKLTTRAERRTRHLKVGHELNHNQPETQKTATHDSPELHTPQKTPQDPHTRASLHLTRPNSQNSTTVTELSQNYYSLS